MSITSKFFDKIKFKDELPVKIKGRKSCKSLKKCGNCTHAKLLSKYPNNGLLNEYSCDKRKCKVLNCDKGCLDFNNRWKKQLECKIKRSKIIA